MAFPTVLFLSLSVAHAATTMWFNTSNIIPLGNGRLGAMVLGSVPQEVLILNEDRIWSGSLNDPNPLNCSQALPTVRDYIWNDDLYAAQALVDEQCMATPLSQQVYQTAGNLTLTFPSSTSLVSSYNHSLDLTTAIATTSYVQDGVAYTRKSFASHPDNIIVLHLSTNLSGALEFSARFTTPMSNPLIVASENVLTMRASGLAMYTLPGSIIYNATLHVKVTGPTASTSVNNSQVVVSDADEAVLLLAIDTNYIRYDDITANPAQRVGDTLSKATSLSYGELLKRHLEDYSALFGRVDISLGTPSPATYLPTDLRRSVVDGDQDIFALYTQYGRYLAIASSRKTEPSNLQGIWNSETEPSWGSKYTLNINQQMNSWLAEPLAIPEILDPLWNLLDDVAERGHVNAKEIYDIERGWVVHHNTGIWRDSAPIDAAFYGFWPMAGAWMVQHMYERYAYSLDLEWVRVRAYPLMKGLSEFMLDYLVEREGYLVPNPSMSPEHEIGDYGDTSVSLTYGSTIDNSLVRDLFNHTSTFATLLGVDSEFASKLMEAHARLMPFRIGSLGQIQEWAVDYDSNGEFTHISHMYALFPSSQIDPRFNTSLAAAAIQSLSLRGDSNNGWPTAWRVNCFARLLDGEKAYYYLLRLLRSFSLPNLWSYNYVFQIDGNFGGANGVAEMLLQSHNGEIHLLPAVPKVWAQGYVKGFRARGAFVVDIAWKDGVLESARVQSIGGVFARVRYAGSAVDLAFDKGAVKILGSADFA